MKQEIYIIGGPNGAGKTTSAFKILPAFLSINEFVNADIIASGLSAFNQQSVSFEAGRIMIRRIQELIRINKSFAFETTLSSRSLYPVLRSAKEMGYRISVIYIWLSSPQLAYQRVKLRYERGGHYVDEETVHRRYERGRKNLKDLYLGIADNWQIYDNSNDHIVLISERSLSGSDMIFDEIIYHKIVI